MSQAELNELKGFKEEKDLTARLNRCIVKHGVQLLAMLMFSEQNTGFIYSSSCVWSWSC